MPFDALPTVADPVVYAPDAATELLIRARRRIAYGWEKGAYVRYGRYCAVGAILADRPIMPQGWVYLTELEGIALGRLRLATGQRLIEFWNKRGDVLTRRCCARSTGRSTIAFNRGRKECRSTRRRRRTPSSRP